MDIFQTGNYFMYVKNYHDIYKVNIDFFKTHYLLYYRF